MDRHMVTAGMCSCGLKLASRPEARAHLEDVDVRQDRGAHIATVAIKIILVVTVSALVAIFIVLSMACSSGECFGTGAGF